MSQLVEEGRQNGRINCQMFRMKRLKKGLEMDVQVDVY